MTFEDMTSDIMADGCDEWWHHMKREDKNIKQEQTIVGEMNPRGEI